jgi:hypothetical protein
VSSYNSSLTKTLIRFIKKNRYKTWQPQYVFLEKSLYLIVVEPYTIVTNGSDPIVDTKGPTSTITYNTTTRKESFALHSK